MKQILFIVSLFISTNLFSQEEVTIKKVEYPLGYEAKIDEVYSEINGWKGREDVYYNPKAAKPTPVVFNIHGGGWNHGVKESQTGYGSFFKMGFAVANIEYRLTAEATDPAAIEDVRAAILYVVQHAKEWNIDPANTSLTYSAQGNFYQSPNGLGLSSATGFTNQTLTFGAKTNGILPPPSLVQDAATNTATYSALLNYLDVNGKTRTALFDVGCQELNGTGNTIASPLDSTLVGAGKPVIITPVSLVAFNASVANNAITLKWLVENEISFQQYEVEYSNNGVDFMNAAIIKAEQKSSYSYVFKSNNLKTYFRLKLVDRNGKFTYSNIISVAAITTLNVYPNPAKDVINIQLKNSSNNTVLKIVDAVGRSIKNIYAISNSVTIQTTDLINGMYHIQVIENNQIINTYPIIISNK